MKLASSGDRDSDRGGYPAVRYERGVVAESPTLCVGFREGKGIAIYNCQSKMLRSVRIYFSIICITIILNTSCSYIQKSYLNFDKKTESKILSLMKVQDSLLTKYYNKGVYIKYYFTRGKYKIMVNDTINDISLIKKYTDEKDLILLKKNANELYKYGIEGIIKSYKPDAYGFLFKNTRQDYDRDMKVLYMRKQVDILLIDNYISECQKDNFVCHVKALLDYNDSMVLLLL